MRSVETETHSFSFNFRVALIILFCVLFYCFLVHPLRQQLETIHRSVASLESALEKREAKESQLAHCSARLALQRKKLAGLLSDLGRRPLSPLQVLQELASSNGVEIGWSKTPSQHRSQPGNKSEAISPKREVSVDLRGRFLSLRAYLEDIAQLEWNFGIKSCVIESGPNHNESSNLRARLVLEVPAL